MLKLFARAALAACFMLGGAAHASWPERPVTLIAPFAAGGITDVLARLTAERLHAKFKQTFLVQNDTGVAGVIGTTNAARAKPDGYTLFFGPISLITLAPLTHKVNFDPENAFTPVSIVASSPFVITASEAFPAKSLSEFVAEVKKKPGAFSYASAGVSSLTHVASLLFLKSAALEMVHVPYRGVAPAFNDLLAGHVQMASVSPVELKPYVGAGKIKPLAVTSSTRSRHLPDVPTISETLPSPFVATYNGIMAPKGTPQRIVDLIAEEMVAAGKTPEFVEKLNRIGVEPAGTTPAEMAEAIASERARWRSIAGELKKLQ
jgi:tripartite-type tricarboxylate transporter receptor subunit TctC